MARTTAVALLLVGIAAACSGAAPAGHTQTATASPPATAALATSVESPTTQATGMAVHSERYGYSMALPPGWEPVTPARADWDGTSPPYTDVPGMDIYSGPGWLVAAAHATSEKLSQWSAAANEQAKERFGSECGQMDLAETTVDGEPARTMSWSCPIYFVQNVQVVHAGKGYVMAFGVPHSAGIDAKTAFSNLLESFRFGD